MMTFDVTEFVEVNVAFAMSLMNALRVLMALNTEAARISSGSGLSFGAGRPTVNSPMTRFDLS